MPDKETKKIEALSDETPTFGGTQPVALPNLPKPPNSSATDKLRAKTIKALEKSP